MTTASDLIDEVRRHLYSGQREWINSLQDALVATTAPFETTLTFAHDLGPLQGGSYLAVDLEIMYVWSVNVPAKSAVVQRGMLGSTMTSHTAGTLVYVNPKFSGFGIFQELNSDLDDLCSPSNGLFQVVSTDLTYNPAIAGYDLGVTGDLIDVLSVRAQNVGPSKDWITINSYKVDSAASTSDFASGFAITLFESGYPGLKIRVTYSAPFTHFANATATVASTGLAASAADLPGLGAAMRLAGVREVKRNFDESQGDTRRASEVPPNAQLAGYQALAKERARRIKAEAGKLASTWPTRRKGGF